MILEEISIGNFLLFDDEIKSVAEICNLGLIANPIKCSDNWIYQLENERVKPLPVTPELLFGLGFEKKEDIPLANKVAGYIRFDKNNIIITGTKDSNVWYLWVPDSNRPMPVYYVHRLQNLFLILTGEILECVKEEEHDHQS